MQVNEQNLVTVYIAKLSHLKQFPSFFANSTGAGKYLLCEGLQQAFLNKMLANEEKGVLLFGQTTKSL